VGGRPKPCAADVTAAPELPMVRDKPTEAVDSFVSIPEPPRLLRRGCEPLRIRSVMPGDVLLICAECGCASNEDARGWGALHLSVAPGPAVS